jgi:hypothetical protein
MWSAAIVIKGNLIFMLAELPLEQCKGQKFSQNIDLKAMAWAIGFGFQEIQARPKPTPGQHLWLGLAFGLKPSHAHH